MSKHALIGGGTGFIGKRLAGHLRCQGYDVTIISRMPGLGRISWHDLNKSGIPNGVNAVVNVAGQNVLDPTRRWTPGFKQNVWNSRINTSSALAKVIAESKGIEAFVNISGVSHYKPHNDKVYTEYDQVEEFDYMSRLCVEWEKAANIENKTNENQCRLIKVRTGVVVGREGGIIQSMWLPFQLGVGGPLGDGKQILPWIHVEDLCRLIQYSIENKNVSGVLNGVAPDIITNGTFSKNLASSMRRPCLFFVPKFVVEQIYGKDRSALLFTGAKISPKRTLEVGFEFKYPTVKSACDEVVQKR